MFGLYQMAVGASVEGMVLSEMSKVIALNAEGFSAMFCWGFFKGCKEGEGIKLVEGMYDVCLCRDFYGFDFLVCFKV